MNKDKTFAEGVATAIMAILLVPLVIALGLFTSGIAVMYVWNWFMPHIFHQLPTLTLIDAMGVSLVIGYLTAQFNDIQSSSYKRFIMYEFFVTPAMVLATGYVLHLFL